MTKDKLEAQGMFLELLFRGRKDLEKAAPVTVVVQSASRDNARATFSVVGNGTPNTLPRTRWGNLQDVSVDRGVGGWEFRYHYF